MPLKTKLPVKTKTSPKTRKSAGTIVYADGTDFSPRHLVRLYQQAPWSKGRTIDEAKAMLKHTDEAVTAWDGARLVGFGRVLTDYVYRATIWDVIVDKAYQGRGIGTDIMNRILRHPRLKRVELFWLCTRMPGFYERLGFSSKEQIGMVWARSRQGNWSGPIRDRRTESAATGRSPVPRRSENRPSPGRGALDPGRGSRPESCR